MNDQNHAIYAAIPYTATRSASNQWLVRRSESCDVYWLDDTLVRILAACSGGRSLRDHVLHMAASMGGGTATTYREGLAQLIKLGLLYHLEPKSGARRNGYAPSGIDRVGIVTADRPHALRRCVESLLAHCDRFRVSPEIYVIDGSTSFSNRSHNRLLLRELRARRGGRLFHVSRREITRIQRLLVDRGVDRRLARFALAGKTGANRNVLMLLTLGHRVVTFDDDVVCQPWRPESFTENVTLGGHDDCQETAYCGSREAAVTGLPPSEICLLTAHARLLGSTLEDVVRRPGAVMDTRETCSHLLWWLHHGHTPTVSMTFAGLAGDAGTGTNQLATLGTIGVQRQTAHDPAMFQRAITRREIRRSVKSDTITHASWCTTYCAGFNHEELLPPFMPVGRGQDGVLGRMLTYIDPFALSGYLPVGIVHDSDRPAAYAESHAAALAPALRDFVLAAAEGEPGESVSGDRRARMRRLGRRVAETGGADHGVFAEFSARVGLDMHCRALREAEAARDDTNAHWHEALDAYRHSLAERSTDPAFYVPKDVASESTIQERRRRLRSYLTDFGDLISAWPDIVDVARQLDLASYCRTDQR